MRARIFLLLSFIFALVQGPFLPPVFSEGILLPLFVPHQPVKKLLPALLLSGIFFDLFQAQRLGVTSLLFLFFAALFFVLKNQVDFGKPIFFVIAFLVIDFLRAKLVFGMFPL